jgi:hypothetical protein
MQSVKPGRKAPAQQEASVPKALPMELQSSAHMADGVQVTEAAAAPSPGQRPQAQEHSTLAINSVMCRQRSQVSSAAIKSWLLPPAGQHHNRHGSLSSSSRLMQLERQQGRAGKGNRPGPAPGQGLPDLSSLTGTAHAGCQSARRCGRRCGRGSSRAPGRRRGQGSSGCRKGHCLQQDVGSRVLGCWRKSGLPQGWLPPGRGRWEFQ